MSGKMSDEKNVVIETPAQEEAKIIDFLPMISLVVILSTALVICNHGFKIEEANIQICEDKIRNTYGEDAAETFRKCVGTAETPRYEVYINNEQVHIISWRKSWQEESETVTEKYMDLFSHEYKVDEIRQRVYFLYPELPE